MTPTLLVRGEGDFDSDVWRFCRTRSCAVAYFSARGDRVAVEAVRVPISQKESSPDRPVCYCFGYSAADIVVDTAGSVPAAIREHCRRGEDRCPETNPQGTCCLGNVLEIARLTGAAVT